MIELSEIEQSEMEFMWEQSYVYIRKTLEREGGTGGKYKHYWKFVTLFLKKKDWFN